MDPSLLALQSCAVLPFFSFKISCQKHNILRFERINNLKATLFGNIGKTLIEKLNDLLPFVPLKNHCGCRQISCQNKTFTIAQYFVFVENPLF